MLLGHLMKGLNLGWMNSVPEPNMEHDCDEWGNIYAAASYLPHPFIVEPAEFKAFDKSDKSVMLRLPISPTLKMLKSN